MARIKYAAGTLLGALILIGCGTASSSSPVTSSPAPRPSPSATQAVEKLTASQKAQVQTTLQTNIDHYAQLLAAGKAALGTTRYPDANAGLAAFNDSNSSASKFSDWRTQSKAEQDVSYIDALKQATEIYNSVAATGPVTKWEDDTSTALTNWEGDIGRAQGDLAQWVQVAVAWQISEKTDAELAAAEQEVNMDLSSARQDLQQLLAVS